MSHCISQLQTIFWFYKDKSSYIRLQNCYLSSIPETTDAGHNRQVLLLSICSWGEKQDSCPITDTGGIASCDGAIFLEHRPKFPQFLWIKLQPTFNVKYMIIVFKDWFEYHSAHDLNGSWFNPLTKFLKKGLAFKLCMLLWPSPK